MTDVIYNVRRDGFDPTAALALDPLPVDLSKERGCLLVPRDRLVGPVSCALADLVLAHAPAHEHPHMYFTVRRQVFEDGDFPKAPSSWHTDYAHCRTELDRRLAVHNYAVITAGPRTVFIQEHDIRIAGTMPSHKFNRNLLAAKLTHFQIEPWTLVKFNATELHTATTWRGPPQPRLFFRATYDPIARGC